MAGKPKNPKNAWLPKHVTEDKHGYRYRNRATKESARLKDAQGNTIKPGAPKSEVYAAYERLTKEQTFNFGQLIDRYFQSPNYLTKAASTQRDYITYATRIKKTFGEMVPETITSAHVRLYMDAKHQTPTATNHDKSFISMVFNWGLERALINPATPNPCTGVKKLKTEKKSRYFEDADYYAFYNYLIEKGNAAHAAAMAIAYNCASRQQDVLRLLEHRPFNPQDEDCYLTDEYIRIWQKKTGNVQNKRYNPELKQAIELAKAHKRSTKNNITPELIVTKSGSRYTRDGFNATWGRRKKEALQKGIITKGFRFHDLKHKSISDHTGDKKAFSGHATDAMAQHYNHSIATVDSLTKDRK